MRRRGNNKNILKTKQKTRVSKLNPQADTDTNAHVDRK